MGFFTRRSARPETLSVWQPDGSGLHVTDGDDMDDDGCAGSEAFGARFALGSAPGATITVWAYPSFAAPDAPGNFQAGYRCEYRTAGGRCILWDVLYDYDPEFYDDLEFATAVCRDIAETLSSTRRDGPSPDGDPGFFDWDGEPW